MKRRDFLKSVTGVAAGAMVPAPAIWSAAKADARSETLLIVSEGGPNNLDIHGVGTNVPGYEVSWNCYDRLISHEMKSGPGGVPYYDRDKFKPELAEDMNVEIVGAAFGDDQQRLRTGVGFRRGPDRGRGRHRTGGGQSGHGFQEIATLHGDAPTPEESRLWSWNRKVRAKP